MTRDEVMAVIKKASEELGYVPTLDELIRTGRLKKQEVRRNFGPYREALKACGLEREGQGYKVSLDALFLDWAGLVRKMGKVPSLLEYEMQGRYSVKPFTRHFGGWLHIPAGLMRHAQEQGLEGEWKDELEIVARHIQAAPVKARNSSWTSGSPSRPRIRLDEPIYGPPMADTHLLMEPTNEQGVIFLFGAVGRKLGFVVIQVQSGYPDCEAFREVEPGRWQRVRIEFEYESRNFLAHGHAPEKCDLIVCWSHNWEESPLEVVELKSAMRQILTTD